MRFGGMGYSEMKAFKSLLDFFLYSNLFISLCAAAMAAETFLLLHSEINWLYVVFAFSSTLVYYDLPSLFFAEKTFSESESTRLKWIYGNQKTLFVLLIGGIIVSAAMLFFFPLRFVPGFVPIGLIALAYFFPQTGLRKIMGLKAGVIALVWTGVTAIYPLLIRSDYDIQKLFTGENKFIVLQNFFFMFPLCVIFNVRDIEADKKAGVKTFASVYGTEKTIIICILSLFIFSALVYYCWKFSIEANLLFTSSIISAIFILRATPDRNDYYYSLWIDGMILLQFLLVWVAVGS
jgi:4-hydroxybenzoate polyprenyltransferase